MDNKFVYGAIQSNPIATPFRLLIMTFLNRKRLTRYLTSPTLLILPPLFNYWFLTVLYL